jgi:hypothetical protein
MYLGDKTIQYIVIDRDKTMTLIKLIIIETTSSIIK